MPLFLINIFVFILGTILGSFFNVCIHRLPREESVAWPGSKCPACAKPIIWHDNIPLLSFFTLGGKCRNCQVKISFRYWVVEAVTGFVFLWIWINFGWSAQSLAAVILFSLLWIASVVDLEHQIIPDEISLGGLACGVVLSGLFPTLHHELVWWKGLVQSGIGLLAGGAMIYLTGVLGNMIFRKDTMGGGDVKLLAMLGSFLGWQRIILVFFFAPILALPFGLFLRFVRKQELIPFGPFLSLAGWLAFLWGDQLIAWYWYGLHY